MTDPLVEVRDLQKYFFEQDSLLDRLLGEEPVAIKAVDGITFDVARGETLGLVGESGCGKSTAGETLLRLQEPTAGAVRFDGENVFELSSSELSRFRRNASIVFQDPFSSLDPRRTIGDTVKQPLDVHSWPDDASGREVKQRRKERVRELLERVGLSGNQFERYPHEFSGGQRQRIGIARALALDPEFVVLDEPTSALDVSVQAQVLNLLSDLQEEFGLTYLLISHDLSVIRHICDRVAVMYLGELVEIGPSEEVFSNPQHPYTEALLESVPRASTDEQDRDVATLAGDVPSPRNPPSGCRFRTRCPKVIPPRGMDIDQDAFRAITTVRNRIESREIDLEGAREYVETHEGTADDATVVARLYDRLVDAELPSAHERQVRKALGTLVRGDWEEAAATLSEYESVCEQVSPVLQARESHPAACHLRDQPEEVETAVAEADVDPAMPPTKESEPPAGE
jgi:peptide/nickel transport system ATP-binding protein